MGDFTGVRINCVNFFKKDICSFLKVFFCFFTPVLFACASIFAAVEFKKEELCFM